MRKEGFNWEIIFEPMQGFANRIPGDKSGLWRVVGRKTDTTTGIPSETKIFGENLTFEEAFNLCYEKEKELNFDAETEEMAKLYRKGLSLKEVGERFGLTRQAVQLRLQKAGVSRRRIGNKSKFDKINKSKLEKLYSENKTLAEIAEYFSVSIWLIHKVLKFYKIPKRHRTGKWGELFRSLKIGESTVVKCEMAYPRSTLHQLARRKGMKISINKLNKNKFRITRLM